MINISIQSVSESGIEPAIDLALDVIQFHLFLPGILVQFPVSGSTLTCSGVLYQ